MSESPNRDPRSAGREGTRAGPIAGDHGFPRILVGWAERYEWRIIGAMAVLYVAYFTTLCVLEYRAYSYGDFDLPIFDQAVWTTSRFVGFFECSIRFGHVFTDHLPFILIGAVPLYWALGWLVPGALILLFLQTAALGGTVFPIYLLARREVGRILGISIALAYLLYPALGYMNLFEFHPGVLAVFFLAWTFYFLCVRRWRLFLLFMVLSLACREDVALPVFMLGIFAVLVRRRQAGARWANLRWVIVPTATGLLYFILAVKVIVPAFHPAGRAETESPFVQLYAYLADDPSATPGAGEIVRAIVTRPVESFERASRLSNKKIGLYTLHLLAPSGGLALLAPHGLLLAFPSYVQNVLAAKWQSSTIFYQYTANLTPFIFISLILGVGWLGRLSFLHRRHALIAVYVIASAVIASILWGKPFHPTRDPYGIERVYTGERDFYQQDWETRLRREDLAPVKDWLVREIGVIEERERAGERASVLASFDFLHRVPMRSALYSWHYVKFGHDPITGESLNPDPMAALDAADLALLDFRDPLTFEDFTHRGSGELQRAFAGRGNWGIRYQFDSCVMLERGRGSGNLGSLAAPVAGPGEVPASQPALVPAPGRPDLGLRLVRSELRSGKVRIGDDERHVLEVVCQFALDPRLPPRRVFTVSRALAIFEVSGREGTIYRRAWPLTYTLFLNAEEWPRMRGPREAPSSLRVVYPLLLQAGTPPGRRHVTLALGGHLLEPPAASAALGSVVID